MSVRTATAIACASLTACATIPAGTHYTVELDVYVQDVQQVCTQAWNAALPDHGPAIAEMVTMTRGEFDIAKCLATVYQKMPLAGGESRGMYVRAGK